jgi:hypothetical protein
VSRTDPIKKELMTRRRLKHRLGSVALAGGLGVAGSCQGSDSGTTPVVDGGDAEPIVCSISKSEIFNGGPGKDGIPALTNPPLVLPREDEASFLRDGDRVIGLVVEGEPIAVPLGILWWHEIVNLEAGGRRLAVTHCPLTGSSLAFDRDPLGGVELGVSGLLYRNNLMMYDRSDDESLWPQMLRRAGCGAKPGTALAMFPVMETTWEGWRVLFPGTRVVGSNTGYATDYRVYPYGDYDRLDNSEILFPMGELDSRRPPKERVLGIPDGADGGRAYPFGALAALGPVAVVDEGEHVVFWSQAARAAMAYRPLTEGQRLTFEVLEGKITDLETGSTWDASGIASSGSLAGRRLEPLTEAYVAYWFAWAAFHDNTTLWPGP